ncbi:MAG: nuclear transport factor 2 family protein [Actinomycetota bacterium]|nr:nuclear transport factor 2 family protein [Actinomycetota bacterium]
MTEQLLAEREIRRRMLDYCRGIDRCDAELVASTYHPDATDDHGAFQGSGHDLARFATEALLANYEATMHTIGDSIIDFTDDSTAYVETYVFADHRGVDDDGDFLERFGARYADRFEKREGSWLVADRVVLVEWSDLARITPTRGTRRYARGLRNRDDLAYRHQLRDPAVELPRYGTAQ